MSKPVPNKGPKSQVQQKSSKSNIMRSGQTNNRSRPITSNGVKTLSGHEAMAYLQSSVSTGGPIFPVPGNTGNSIVVSLNPSLERFFPRLSYQSKLYNKYRFKRLEIYGKAKVSGFATAGQAGQVNVVYNVDPTDSINIDVTNMHNATAYVSALTCDDFKLILTPKELGTKWYFTRLGGIASVDTLREFDQGRLFISNYGSAADLISTHDITCKYVVELDDEILLLNPNLTNNNTNQYITPTVNPIYPRADSTALVSGTNYNLGGNVAYGVGSSWRANSVSNTGTNRLLYPMHEMSSLADPNTGDLLLGNLARLSAGWYSVTGQLSFQTDSAAYFSFIEVFRIIGTETKCVYSALLNTGITSDGPSRITIPILDTIGIVGANSTSTVDVTYTVTLNTSTAVTYIIKGGQNSVVPTSFLVFRREMDFD